MLIQSSSFYDFPPIPKAPATLVDCHSLIAPQKIEEIQLLKGSICQAMGYISNSDSWLSFLKLIA
jgi:hypothetical protein